LLYGRFYLPTGRLDALYSTRLTPTIQALVAAISDPRSPWRALFWDKMSTQSITAVLSRRTEPIRANLELRLNCTSLNIIAMKSKDKGNEPWRQPEPEAVICIDKFGR
jgi:hypothetical protein